MNIKSWGTIFVCATSGIFIARNYDYTILLLVALLLIIFGIILKKLSKQILSVVCILILAACYYSLRIPDIPANLTNISAIELEGNVIKIDKKKDTISFVLKTENESFYIQKVKVYCYAKLAIHEGDKVKIKGELTIPNSPGNPGTFNYRRFLADQKIFYQMGITNNNNIQVIDRAAQSCFSLKDLRLKVEDGFRSILPNNEADILLGMLLGEKEEIDDEVYLQFQKTGIVHLLAVSGLHVGFILLLSGWLANLLQIMPLTKFLCNSSLIIFYGTLINWPISVMRAVIMAFLGLLAIYFGRERKLYDILGLAGIIILLLNPADLFRISFQLSFVATWGLVYIYPAVREKINYKSKAIDFLLIPFCAQLTTLPIIAYYFNILSPIAVLANLMVIYIAGAVVLLGFLAIPFCLCNAQVIAEILLQPTGLLIELILALNQKWVSLPFASIWVATPSLLSVVLYYSALLLIVFTLKGKLGNKKGIIAASFIPCFFIYLLLPAGFWNTGYLECTFLDVGQGDCIIIKTPQGKYMMIDGGGSEVSDIGKNRVLPFLHHQGIRKMEWLVNTHPDKDHLQGVERVAEELKVKNILIPKSLIDSPAYDHLKNVARERKINLLGLSTNQEWFLDKDIKVSVLHPEPDPSKVSDYNDQSLVFKLSYKDFSVLFTGDIGIDTMKGLSINNDFNCSVIKVPHHGSRTSNCAEFYEKIKPIYAVIQAGKNNRFGHPHPEILQLLASNNISVLRNDLNGAVFISSNGHNLRVNTYVNNQ